MNRPETVVSEMCSGIALTNPDVIFDQKYRVIRKKEINRKKVSLISGGGSGHEPAHAGYVGRGMLDAAVCGDVFASPSQIQVYQAIKETAGDCGTLLIIKNYSGDIMNFKNAAALAQEDGLRVEYIKVEDDIAVQDSLYTVGRRGVAGTVLVHKVAGAAAECRLTLEAVKQVAQHAADSVKSIGFAFTSCTVPAKGTPTFSLEEDEMEYGVGIHGEPGIRREKLLTADELAARMSKALLEELKPEKGQKLAVLVNGFGATPAQELYIFMHSVRKYLNEQDIAVYRSFVGNYMTSIDMAGASLSFMKLDDELSIYIDVPDYAPGFPVYGPVEETQYHPLWSGEQEPEPDCFYCEESWKNISGQKISLDNMKAMTALMGECILKNEVPFCELDSFAGDGDFGMSVAKGFRQLKREWSAILDNDAVNIGQFLKACALVIMEHCGGASGPIWGSAFRGAGFAAGGRTELSTAEFAACMQAAVKNIQATGERSFGKGAQVGDKTLIDALAPCADRLTREAKVQVDVKAFLQAGAQAAVAGAKATEHIVARMGRAGVVGSRSLGYPDAGAYALGVIFTEVSGKMKESGRGIPGAGKDSDAE